MIQTFAARVAQAFLALGVTNFCGIDIFSIY
jgi:hypothetical protein